jgi:hypothetical protein
MRRGGSINGNCKNNGSQKGPLRKILHVLHHGRHMFDRDYVKFECGHEGSATIGAQRGRCHRCKEATSGS